jgi:LysM repeat protein
MLLRFIKNNNYVVLLFVFSMLLAVIAVNTLQEEPSEYITVQVKNGDTLWSIATEYSDKSKLSNEKFIKWTQDQNDIAANSIKVGEEIVIPVKKSKVNNIELAKK